MADTWGKLPQLTTFSFSLFMHGQCFSGHNSCFMWASICFCKIRLCRCVDVFHIVCIFGSANVNAWCFENVFLHFRFFNGRLLQSSLMHRAEKWRKKKFKWRLWFHSWRIFIVCWQVQWTFFFAYYSNCLEGFLGSWNCIKRYGSM